MIERNVILDKEESQSVLYDVGCNVIMFTMLPNVDHGVKITKT